MRVPPEPQVDQRLAHERGQVLREQALELQMPVLIGLIRTEEDVRAPLALALPQHLPQPRHELGLLEPVACVIIRVDADELEPAGPEAEVAALLLLSVRVGGLFGVEIVEIRVAP